MKNAIEVLEGIIGRPLAILVADELEAAKLAIYDKRAVNPAPRKQKAQPMTDALRQAIVYDWHTTDMTQSQIAAKHNVNSGRVSETLAGIPSARRR